MRMMQTARKFAIRDSLTMVLLVMCAQLPITCCMACDNRGGSREQVRKSVHTHSPNELNAKSLSDSGKNSRNSTQPQQLQNRTQALTSSTGHMRYRLKVPNCSVASHSFLSTINVDWTIVKWTVCHQIHKRHCTPRSYPFLLRWRMHRYRCEMDSLRQGCAPLRIQQASISVCACKIRDHKAKEQESMYCGML